MVSLELKTQKKEFAMTSRHSNECFYGVKDIISKLLGSDAWYSLKESTEAYVWRRYGKRCINAIRASISESYLQADDLWKEEVESLCESSLIHISKANSMECVISHLCCFFIELSFRQAGCMPESNYNNKNVSTHKHNWNLALYRTPLFIQTEDQKESLFWSVQQKRIGFPAQLKIKEMHRKSKSKLSYSKWCDDKKLGL